MIRIKDSSTNKLINMDNDHISIYNCGPTVYNDVHIGNIRPIITFDVLYRYLKFIKKNVIYVHNITDIDDKIIDRAIKLKQNELTLSNHYYEEYLKILKNLNIQKMDVLPKVSDNIEGIINYVNKQIKNHNAYVIDGNVFFDVNFVNDYGSISHQKIDKLMNETRNTKKLMKHNPLDFVLWKKTNVGISWKSPWNSHGRPGWHTECSYLINKYIGSQVDIHGGGVDLKFPHHENENAQNKALYGVNLAKCWMHMGHININGEKMSKSLNNFVLAKEVLEKYDTNVVRWFFYQTQYEKPLSFSYEQLENTKNEFNRFIRNINSAFTTLYLINKKVKQNIKNTITNEFKQSIENNLDFPNMIKNLWELAKGLVNISKMKDEKQLLNNLSYLISELNIMGIKYINPLNKKNIKIIDDWQYYLQKKDYRKSDEIRNKLINLNLI